MEQNKKKFFIFRKQGIEVVLALISLLFFGLFKAIPSPEGRGLEEMVRASQVMEEALKVIKECRREKGLGVNLQTDINQTGLIGLEFSAITTSIGSLEAKRTTANPNFAGLLVYLLQEAGVKRGDVIGVGASGSFPALILAVLSAAKALEVEALVIASLGASQWGANDPAFHWLEMWRCLDKNNVFASMPVAFSLGGEGDTGEGMAAEGKALLLKDIKESGHRLIYEESFGQNVEARMQLYEKRSGKRGIKAFINIGGSSPNIGIDSQVLSLKPGLTEIRDIPGQERRGVLYRMASQKIPVIHLLQIKGLASRSGLPWDPAPLPRPGEGPLYQHLKEKEPRFVILAVGYFLILGIVLAFRNKIERLYVFF